MVCAPVWSFSEGIIDHTCAQTMLYLTCTTINIVDLAHYGVDCGTKPYVGFELWNKQMFLSAFVNLST